MRLAPLLAALSDEDLERLAVEHVRTDERLPRPQLCNFLEGALRSYRFVSDFIINRQPPTFAVLTLLLDAPGYRLPKDGFRATVMAETRRLADLIDSGDLLARDRQLHLYRRALYEARRNDLDLNSSEAALLALLRRESGIAQVEHFLIEHHEDLREFWDKEDAFEHEKKALRSAGLLFIAEGQVVIPEELALAIRQTLGIDMPTDSARRLFGYLSNGELASALQVAGSRTSGSKDARLERLLLERIQPRVVLRSVGLSTLKDICRATDASVSGNKDELIERAIAHFAQGRDQREEEPVEPPRHEPRRLDQGHFETLFSVLLQQELSDILRRLPELRQTGTKETRIRTLWDAHLSETTLLGELMNRQLEDVLHRLGLRLGGAKGARIERIIDHFGAAVHTEGVVEGVDHSISEQAEQTRELDADVLVNQNLFRQKASNPQASLQPWLEHLLNATGLIRCYATEDANPTKQLKNKLSQAAAARNGLLVLLLADENAFSKAREALLERWMANAEWPKSVASVALAYPLGSPAIAAVVEHTHSPWARTVRSRLFPSAELISVAGSNRDSSSGSAGRPCPQCGQNLPAAARFCPHCGARVDHEGTPDAGTIGPRSDAPVD
jgi:hypothetical protein